MNRFLIIILLLLTAAITNYSYSRPEPELERTALERFPKKFAEWDMINEQIIEDSSMAVLRVDDYIMRNYVNRKGERIGLYIGYFDTQREGKQVHSPRQCLPGSGWNILENREYVLNLGGEKESGRNINLYLMGKGTERQLYLWWYHGRGRIFANEYLNKVYLIWDSMTKRRTDGALVRINMPIVSTIDQTLNTQLGFVADLFPLLPQFIPS